MKKNAFVQWAAAWDTMPAMTNATVEIFILGFKGEEIVEK